MSGYPHLALCVLDAVWMVGVNAATVRNVVSRYCVFAGLPDPSLAVSGADCPPEPLRRFVEAVERDGPEGFAADALQNRQRTLGSHSILKAEAAYRVAETLHSRGVSYPAEVAPLRDDPDFETTFRAIPGLGPAAWERLFALCGGVGNRQQATEEAIGNGQQATGNRERKTKSGSYHRVCGPLPQPLPLGRERGA